MPALMKTLLIELCRPLATRHSAGRCRRPLLSMPLAMLVVLGLLATPASAAGTYSWTGGGGNTSWSTTGNWASGTAPTGSTNTLVFSGSLGTTNTNTVSSLSLSNLTFASGASAFTLSGSSITLSSGTISSLSSNLQTVNLGIELVGSNLVTSAANRAIVLGGNIVGSGSLNKTGAGVLTLSGSNSYTGATNVTTGTLALGSNTALGSATAVTVSAELATGSFTNSVGAVTLTSGSITGGGTLVGTGYTVRAGSVSAVLGGTGALTKTTVGTVTLSGSNTYTGLTTVSAGTLAYGTSNAIASGDVTVNAGGELALGNYSDTVGLVTLNGGTASSAVISGGSGILTASSYSLVSGSVTANLAGSGTLSKTSAQTVALTGSNSFTGDMTISQGVLNIQNNNALGTTSGSTAIASSGAALELQNNITVTGETIVYSGVGVSSQGAIRNISGTNTLAGNLIQNGTLAGRINSDAGLLRLVSGTLSNSSNLGLTVGGAGDTLIGSIITGTNALNKDGAGTLTLSGSNTFTGATNITDGKLVYGTNDALGTGNLTVNGANAVLNLGSYSDSIGRFTLTSGTLAMAASNSNTAQLISTNVNAMALGTTNTLDLAGSSTTAGIYKLLAGTAISGTFGTVNNLNSAYSLLYSGSTLDLQQKAVFGTVTAIPSSGSIITGGTLGIGYTVANNAASGGANLAFTGTAGSNLTGSTSGTAAAGSSSGTISGMAFTGATTGSNQAGVFTINAPAAFGTTTTTSTVSVNVYDHASPTVASLAGGTLSLGTLHAGFSSATSTNSLTGSNAAGYRVAMSGSATAANGISLTTLSGVAAGSNTPITATLAAGGTAGAINQNFTYTFADDSVLNGASANLGTASILVTGSVYTGQSTWATNGSGSWGTLNNSFGTNWGANQGSPGLDAGYTNTDTATFGSAVTSGTAVVSLDGAAPSLRAITFSNTSASYNIAQGSSGSLTLSGSGGAATVDVAGNQSISAPLVLGTSVDIDVAAGSQLTVNGAISGTSGSELNLTGPGSTIFTGTSNYTGNTNVNAGELLLAGALGNTAMSVASGATLAGNGSILGVVTVQDGGTISPGSGPYDGDGPTSYATLTTGSLSLGGTASTATTLMDIQGVGTGAGTAGINYDQIAAGNITYGGDLVLNFWTTESFATWTVFHLFDFTGVAFEHLSSLTIGTGAEGNVYAGLSFRYVSDGEWIADGGSEKPTLTFSERTGDLTVALVPEPSTLLIAGIGIAMTFYQARRKVSRRRQRLQANAGVAA